MQADLHALHEKLISKKLHEPSGESEECNNSGSVGRLEAVYSRRRPPSSCNTSTSSVFSADSESLLNSDLNGQVFRSVHSGNSFLVEQLEQRLINNVNESTSTQRV